LITVSAEHHLSDTAVTVNPVYPDHEKPRTGIVSRDPLNTVSTVLLT